MRFSTFPALGAPVDLAAEDYGSPKQSALGGTKC
ncbi:hypothetical protein SRABI83_01375 [Arthrobacter sp. Bi83]|nr:hypothetical protein SRABI83_01375 [Arthrobacter sp. Bi83]